MSLKVQNLSFGYKNNNVLNDVSFEAQSGQLLAILGPNGVGKSTLFKCILKLEKKYNGTIEADGDRLSGM